MFSKQQRDRLNQLCTELYGVAGKWRKLMDDPKFKKVVEVYEDPDAPTYVQVMTRKGRPGTIFRTETAIKRGIVKPDYKPQVVKKTKTVDLTFDEFIHALESSLESVYISYMDTHAQTLVLAKQFMDDALTYNISLILTDENKETVSELTALLKDEALQKRLEAFTVDATGDKEPQIPGLPLDPEQFLTNLVFVKNHKDSSLEEIALAFGEAKDKHQASLRAQRIADSKLAMAR